MSREFRTVSSFVLEDVPDYYSCSDSSEFEGSNSFYTALQGRSSLALSEISYQDLGANFDAEAYPSEELGASDGEPDLAVFISDVLRDQSEPDKSEVPEAGTGIQPDTEIHAGDENAKPEELGAITESQAVFEMLAGIESAKPEAPEAVVERQVIIEILPEVELADAKETQAAVDSQAAVRLPTRLAREPPTIADDEPCTKRARSMVVQGVEEQLLAAATLVYFSSLPAPLPSLTKEEPPSPMPPMVPPLSPTLDQPLACQTPFLLDDKLVAVQLVVVDADGAVQLRISQKPAQVVENPLYGRTTESPPEMQPFNYTSGFKTGEGAAAAPVSFNAVLEGGAVQDVPASVADIVRNLEVIVQQQAAAAPKPASSARAGLQSLWKRAKFWRSQKPVSVDSLAFAEAAAQPDAQSDVQGSRDSPRKSPKLDKAAASPKTRLLGATLVDVSNTLVASDAVAGQAMSAVTLEYSVSAYNPMFEEVSAVGGGDVAPKEQLWGSKLDQSSARSFALAFSESAKAAAGGAKASSTVLTPLVAAPPSTPVSGPMTPAPELPSEDPAPALLLFSQVEDSPTRSKAGAPTPVLAPPPAPLCPAPLILASMAASAAVQGAALDQQAGSVPELAASVSMMSLMQSRGNSPDLEEELEDAPGRFGRAVVYLECGPEPSQHPSTPDQLSGGVSSRSAAAQGGGALLVEQLAASEIQACEELPEGEQLCEGEASEGEELPEGEQLCEGEQLSEEQASENEELPEGEQLSEGQASEGAGSSAGEAPSAVVEACSGGGSVERAMSFGIDSTWGSEQQLQRPASMPAFDMSAAARSAYSTMLGLVNKLRTQSDAGPDYGADEGADEGLEGVAADTPAAPDTVALPGVMPASPDPSDFDGEVPADSAPGAEEAVDAEPRAFRSTGDQEHVHAAAPLAAAAADPTPDAEDDDTRTFRDTVLGGAALPADLSIRTAATGSPTSPRTSNASPAITPLASYTLLRSLVHVDSFPIAASPSPSCTPASPLTPLPEEVGGRPLNTEAGTVSPLRSAAAQREGGDEAAFSGAAASPAADDVGEGCVEEVVAPAAAVAASESLQVEPPSPSAEQPSTPVEAAQAVACTDQGKGAGVQDEAANTPESQAPSVVSAGVAGAGMAAQEAGDLQAALQGAEELELAQTAEQSVGEAEAAEDLVVDSGECVVEVATCATTAAAQQQCVQKPAVDKAAVKPKSSWLACFCAGPVRHD